VPATPPATPLIAFAGRTPMAAHVIAALESALARRQEATLALAASLDPDEAPALLRFLTSLDAEMTGLLALLERLLPPESAPRVA
jgi:hypothetical protein